MAQPVVTTLALVVSFALACAATAQTDIQTNAETMMLHMPVDPATRQISVVVKPGLSSNAGLPDDLRLARTSMLDGSPISPAQLRALADLGDGLAAQKYVRYLISEVPGASPSDIAYYATVAISTGRVWTMPEAVAAMRLLDPATEPASRISAYVAMLYPHAWAGNSLALDAVIDLNGEGRLFGPLSDATRARIIEADAAYGGGRSTMRLALALLSKDPLSNADRALARDYLTRAATNENLSVSVTATNLLTLLDNGFSTVLSQ
jgi:hypothetical protein